MKRPTKRDRAVYILSSFAKRAKVIGPLKAIRECDLYVSKYNNILKFNNSYNHKYGLINFSFYCHIIETFPKISENDLLNYIPYTITYAVYIKNNINRAKYTYDKVSFYKTAIENNIAIPKTFGYTDNDANFISLQGKYEQLKNQAVSNMVIGKPRMANSGTGVIIADTSKQLLPNYVYQQKAIDHPDIKSLTLSDFPSTIRLAIYNDAGDLEVIGAHIRLNAGAIIDHLFSGSIFVDIDTETGILEGFGIDNESKRFEKHPKSNIRLEGFQIPFWQEVIAEAEKTCKSHQELPLIGLDIVITKDGPVILEINGGFHTFAIQFNKKLGNHAVFKKYLDGFE